MVRTNANQTIYFFIGLKCGNSKWAVKVVWVRYSLMSLVHLVVVFATNTFYVLFICRNEGKLQNLWNISVLYISVLLTDLLLTVANLFEPSVDGESSAVLLYSYSVLFVSPAAVTAIKAQIEASNGIINVCPYIYFLCTYLRMSTPSTVRFLGRRICCISMAIRVRNILAFELHFSSADCHTMQAIAGAFGPL